jgi:hypothetical protein
MDFIQWLQELGRDANPGKAGFQPQLLYLAVCVGMPVAVGMLVGFGLRLIERIFGVELGKGGH